MDPQIVHPGAPPPPPSQPAGSRVLIVGDVHACARELGILLDRLAPARDDRVVFLGDLVDRGPDVAKVFDLAREVRGELVLGNHEDKFLRWEEGRRNSPTGESGVQLAPHHRATLAELRPEDWETMRRGTRYLEIPEHDVLVIHAGLRPGVALAEQDPDDLCRLQNIGPSGRRRRWGTPGTSFWAEHCDRPGWVVYGHTHSAQPLRYERTLGIDTGCCFGGMLTALELPVWRLHQVPAARNYFLETAARYYPGRFG